MKYYIHIKTQTDTVCAQVEIDNHNTLSDLAEQISKQYHSDSNLVQFSTAWNAKPLPNQTMLVSSLYKEKSDVFVTFDKKPLVNLPQATPISVNYDEPENEYLIPITKYTFYELNDMNVRVILDLKNIGNLPAENFVSRFLERSFQLKIKNYNGKNYIFGCGRLHNRIDVSACKFLVKPDKILITLRKFKKEDNWFTLFKTRTIGGTDSD